MWVSERLILYWIPTESSRAGRDHSSACNPISKVKGRKLGRDWRSCCSCLATRSRTRFPASLKGPRQPRHSSRHPLVSQPHGQQSLTATSALSLSLPSSEAQPDWNSPEQQQCLNSFKTRSVYWAVVPESWWQMSPSQLTLIGTAVLLKRAFLEPLPLQHLQLPSTKPSQLTGPQQTTSTGCWAKKPMTRFNLTKG